MVHRQAERDVAAAVVADDREALVAKRRHQRQGIPASSRFDA
jgi:hypothetical protein